MKKNIDNNNLPAITPYEFFVALLSILSIINIFLYSVFDTESIKYVIGIIDLFLSLVFFGDFLQRLIRAESKSRYFFHDFGWADLLASIPAPQLKLFRIFRILKAYRMVKNAGPRNVTRGFLRSKASSALYLVLFLIVLLLEFGSIAVLAAESSSPEANITTASDAIWWVYVTITTVGYGDKYPVTNAGRGVGVLVMFVGVGLFGVVTGFLANKFLPQDNDLEKSEVMKLRSELEEIKELIKSSK